MRKVAVIEAGDGEHPHKVEGDGPDDGNPAPAVHQHAEAAEVEDDKGNAAQPFNAVGFLAQAGDVFAAEVRVEPADERGCWMRARRGSGVGVGGHVGYFRAVKVCNGGGGGNVKFFRARAHPRAAPRERWIYRRSLFQADTSAA